jgi:N-acetylglucosamine-6-sulfatase
VLPFPGDVPARPVPAQHGDPVQLPAAGGHQKFRGEGRDRSTVATWLDDAGYDTAYFGKYMNGYDDTRYVPPGWDRWFGWLGNHYSPAGEYRLNENGRIETYNRDQVHDTDLLREKAVHFVRAQQKSDRPFFAYVATNAPHSPAYAPERHEGTFRRQGTAASPIVRRGDRLRQG